MKFRPLIYFLSIPMLAFTMVHKYYVSITKVEYVKEKQSVQIISRIFIDDLEDVLQQRYDENIILRNKNENPKANDYVERYLKTKIGIKINGKEVAFNYIGKEYEDDIAIVYLEVEHVNQIKSFEMTNEVLMDLYNEQQNILRTNINSKNKSFMLTKQNDKALLNFN